jgi:uncharacterized protein (DUF3084 family)
MFGFIEARAAAEAPRLQAKINQIEAESLQLEAQQDELHARQNKLQEELSFNHSNQSNLVCGSTLDDLRSFPQTRTRVS